MFINNLSPGSKVAALIINEAGRINRNIRVTISRNSPESSYLTRSIPRSKGWVIVPDVPKKEGGKKDYVTFLKYTFYNEVHIRLSTAGGSSKVYAR